MYDQQLGTVCGRPTLASLWDYDVRLPEPFVPDGNQQPSEEDDVAVATFKELIQAAAVLELAFLASVQRPIVPNSQFLNDLSRQLRSDLDDSEKLGRVSTALRKWRQYDMDRNKLTEQIHASSDQ